MKKLLMVLLVLVGSAKTKAQHVPSAVDSINITKAKQAVRASGLPAEAHIIVAVLKDNILIITPNNSKLKGVFLKSHFDNIRNIDTVIVIKEQDINNKHISMNNKKTKHKQFLYSKDFKSKNYCPHFIGFYVANITNNTYLYEYNIPVICGGSRLSKRILKNNRILLEVFKLIANEQ